MADRISYVGLDVHKDGIVVAIADSGLRGEVREYGRIANTMAALERLVRKLGGPRRAFGTCGTRSRARTQAKWSVSFRHLANGS